MNETLILLLSESPGDPVRWAFLGEGRVALADKSEDASGLAALAERAAASTGA